MDTPTVKKILNIKTTNTKYDDYFDTVVPMIEADVKEETNLTTIPVGLEIVIAKTAQYLMKDAGLTARTLGDASYNYDTDVPEYIKQKIRKYRRLSW